MTAPFPIRALQPAYPTRTNSPHGCYPVVVRVSQSHADRASDRQRVGASNVDPPSEALLAPPVSNSQRPISRARTAPRMNAAIHQSLEARQDQSHGQCQSGWSHRDGWPANLSTPSSYGEVA